MAKKVTIRGHVKTITFFNEETGFFIAKISTSKGEYAVKGTYPSIAVGEFLEAQGVWEQTNWGQQIKAETVSLQQPTMVDAIEKYLSSSVPGIGKTFAKKLVDAFGEKVFDIIENRPEELKTLHGIGKVKIKSLIESYNTQKSIRDIMVFLHKIGLSAMRAKRVYDIYGDSAISRISENPYILAKDVHGIGFLSADAVAMKMGLEATSDHRIKAGILHALVTAQSEGHCGLPRSNLLLEANLLLEVGHPLIDKAIDEELAINNLYRETYENEECIFPPSMYFAEKHMARLVLDHIRQPVAHPVMNIEGKINAAEATAGFTLAPEQRDAIRLGLQSQMMIITGGPGCGKTTITKLIVDILEQQGLHIAVAAPTGKAADRASKATGHEAKTIHRLLGFNPDGTFIHNESKKLDVDVLVLDEFSMVDVQLGFALMKAIDRKTRIIILGDIFQLPSVGPGSVLADMINSGKVPYVSLLHVFRQGENSLIKVNAAKIRNGEMPSMEYVRGSDYIPMPFSPLNDDDTSKEKCRQDMLATILRVCKDAMKLGFHPVKDVQVLVPMRKGILGVENLNLKLQAMLNPAPPEKVEIYGTSWRVNDKVMQIRNNYKKEVFNGDIGYIIDINFPSKTLTVEYEGGRNIEYFFNEVDELALAYVFTIHKSQGSETPFLVMAVDTSHFIMLKRNLIYTGLTRARQKGVMVCNPKAVMTAVKSGDADVRYSLLKYWLQK